MNKIHFYIILITAALFSACAQIGTLSGGERDTDPPVFLESSPSDKGLNFKGDEIKLTFDEFFVLENLNATFLSSPPLLKKPDFKIKRKSLIINLNEQLKDTTTYTFLFGNSIKDFHEGNKMNDFRFVFSTGDKLDTMEVSGKVIDAVTHKVQPDLLVMLYTNLTDSAPVTDKPYYIAKTDTSGIFKINYIKPGKYKIFALKDNDANLNFNLPNEKIAFTDSLIIPKVKKETRIDTFKAGSVLHTGSEDTAGDTLTKDTVIVYENYIYSPSDIILFAFTEDKNKQYLSGAERETKGKCVFNYSKNTEDLTINGLNFNLTEENSLIEKQDSGKTVIVWLKDKELFSKDTLKFTSSYFNKDSADNKIAEHDTMALGFNFAADTLKKHIKLIDTDPYIDYFSDFSFEAETPVLKADTSKIKFFELTDTIVSDARKQDLIKHFRPAPDTLIFALKRPYVNDFYIKILNADTSEVRYDRKYSDNDTLLICSVKDKNIYEKDTLKLIVFYDNEYFKGQIQKFKDTLNLPLFKQSLLSVKRPSPDTVVLNFKKNITGKTTIELAPENAENWFRRLKPDNNKKIILKITDKNLTEEDTLMLKIRVFDYDNTKGDKIYFEYVKNAVFKHKKQKLKKYGRPQPSEFFLVFNKPLISNPEIKDLRYKNENAFSLKSNKTKDSLICKITDSKIAENDTLKIAVNYKSKYKKKITEHTDTLSLIYKKQRHRKRRTTSKTDNTKTVKDSVPEGKEKISIRIPVDFSVFTDSVNDKKIHVIFNKKEGYSYLLELDSFALEDYYGNYSKIKEYKINVRKKDDYGKITLNISGVKFFEQDNFYFMNDTAAVDSAEYSKLTEGQIILNLYDKDKNLLKTENITEDTVIYYENIIPQTYGITIIYDKNKNRKQDTGNYFKHIQPERIIYFPDEIIVKPNWDNHINIKFRNLNKI